ncbi:hypothetical protein [Nonomuraea sp. NPDC050310]|uniref:hypothetical protein n=1 Tax=unclassified Nonomuraea TaxID=2593643 RepID=UPI003410413D
MKRLLAGLLSAALLLSAAPAHAAPSVRPPRTVKFTERVFLAEDGRRTLFLRRSGAFRLGDSGVAAADVTARLAITPADLPGEAFTWLAAPERTIRVGTTSYLSGGLYGTLLPEGRTWYRYPGGPAAGVTGTYSQLLNIAEPRTRATLLKTAKRTSYGYRGTITLGALYKLSPWFRASAASKPKKPGIVLSWRLTVDAAKLPKRLVTAYTSSGETVIADTRYSGWGSAVTIVPPPPDQVADELATGEEPPAVPPVVGTL